VPLTSFVGRELAEVARLLGTTRLLTLTGPGGVGKTRLGVEAARAAAGGFAAGAAVVALAPLAAPGLVAAAAAAALGAPGLAARSPDEALVEHLRDRALLLVLDNCEHVLAEAARLVARLLAASPGVTVLATSREVLRLSGEHVVAVPPLALPDPTAPAIPERVTAAPAERLFCERARAADAAFALTAENAAAVAAVCARLDGLPLALELAAARVRLLPPRELLERLDPRLPLLTGGPRDAPARQQTLRAALAWSDALLTRDEQALFRRLGVFAGGGTLEAAEAVCAGGTGDEAIAVLDGAASLLDKSLLRREDGPGGEPRLGMLETVGEYARERLEASGEAEAVRRRHAAYFTGLAERAAPELHGPRQREWIDRLERERDNLRAALRWAVPPPGAPPAPDRGPAAAGLGLRLGLALFWFWFVRGPRREGLDWLRRLLALPTPEAPTAERAWALHHAAGLGLLLSDFAAVRALEAEALRLADAGGWPLLEAEAENALGYRAWVLGDHAAARQHLEAALRAEARARAAPGPDSGAPWPHRIVPTGALRALVRVAVAQGNVAAARAAAAAGLAHARASGNPFHLVSGLSGTASRPPTCATCSPSATWTPPPARCSPGCTSSARCWPPRAGGRPGRSGPVGRRTRPPGGRRTPPGIRPRVSSPCRTPGRSRAYRGSPTSGRAAA
jgi:non-specific serine/threonine protein kinase